MEQDGIFWTANSRDRQALYLGRQQLSDSNMIKSNYEIVPSISNQSVIVYVGSGCLCVWLVSKNTIICLIYNMYVCVCLV